MIPDHLPPKINRCNCCDDSEDALVRNKHCKVKITMIIVCEGVARENNVGHQIDTMIIDTLLYDSMCYETGCLS